MSIILLFQVSHYQSLFVVPPINSCARLYFALYSSSDTCRLVSLIVRLCSSNLRLLKYVTNLASYVVSL